MQRRPQADARRAGHGEPIAGVALDAVLDGDGQEARRKPEGQCQAEHDDDGANQSACDLQCFHVDVPIAMRERFTRADAPRRDPARGLFYPANRGPLQER